MQFHGNLWDAASEPVDLVSRHVDQAADDACGSIGELTAEKSGHQHPRVTHPATGVAGRTRKVRIWTFSNRVVKLRALHGFALRDRAINSQPHGGTELGKAINQVPNCDRLIVITDEQSHDAVPDRRGYMINVASAKNGVGYGMWTHIDGWSDKVMD